jgi:ATP diphosphatase
MSKENGIKKLQETLKKLRDPLKGCPWDLKQSHRSLLPYFFEELHEFQECVLNEEPSNVHFQEELGDLLFQVLFHAQLLEEKTKISLDDIADKVANKLVHRHPHVFDPQGPQLKTPSEVEAQWEQRKSLEQGQKTTLSEKLNSIPSTLSSLLRAQRLGEKAASFGFDWKNSGDIWAKIEEELNELRIAPNEINAQEELGDIYFVLAQFARKNGWSSEVILAEANAKFTKRITCMEDLLKDQKKDWKDLDLEALEKIWQLAKTKTQ